MVVKYIFRFYIKLANKLDTCVSCMLSSGFNCPGRWRHRACC